jgi:hypothetical protein
MDINPALGLRAQDFGEIAASALAGVVFLLLGLLSYRVSSPFARSVGIYILLGIILLAFFGVFVDTIHTFLGYKFRWTNQPLEMIEDGGELIVVSIIFWFSYSVAHQELYPAYTPSPRPEPSGA